MVVMPTICTFAGQLKAANMASASSAEEGRVRLPSQTVSALENRVLRGPGVNTSASNKKSY